MCCIFFDRNQSKALKIGDKYILLDLGGGTADIACHKILGNDNVGEIHHPTGGAWGSTYIDHEFEKALHDLPLKGQTTKQIPSTPLNAKEGRDGSEAKRKKLFGGLFGFGAKT